jgi:hypothetical protein
MPEQRDVFISHASEDLRAVALPLKQALVDAGLTVWLDDDELRPGARLRESIAQGLARCRIGVVILSPAYFAKQWPRDELHALMAREEAGHKALVPVRHDVSAAEVTAHDPLLADRLSLAWADGAAAVAAAIRRELAGPPAAPAPWLVDFSHGQRGRDGWDYLAEAFERDRRFTPVDRGWLEQDELLAAAKLLVVPPPKGRRLAAAEIDRVAHWVDSGGGLLLMGCYAERHHDSNFSELAWCFDIEFVDDMVMPAQVPERELRWHILGPDGRNPGYAVRAELAGAPPHALLEGVRDLAFLSGGSMRSTIPKAPELVLSSVAQTVCYRPLGHIGIGGARPNVDAYVESGRGPVPLLMARRHGKGRVVVTATWKLCTVDFGDNAKLLDNAYAWLAGGAG